MKRTLIVLAAVLALMCVFAASASASAAHSQDIWEKLFGCTGIFPISCPGPLPW